MSGTGGPGGVLGRSGPASPIVRWLLLLVGILLVVFGPDTSLGLVALAAGLVLVIGSLVWWTRSGQHGR